MVTLIKLGTSDCSDSGIVHLHPVEVQPSQARKVEERKLGKADVVIDTANILGDGGSTGYSVSSSSRRDRVSTL
jgi:hypothetical protein